MLCNTTVEMICNLNSDPITEADKETIKEIHIWLDGVIGLTIVIIGMMTKTTSFECGLGANVLNQRLIQNIENSRNNLRRKAGSERRTEFVDKIFLYA